MQSLRLLFEEACSKHGEEKTIILKDGRCMKVSCLEVIVGGRGVEKINIPQDRWKNVWINSEI